MENLTNPNIARIWKLRGFVYLLTCQCQCFYVGKTKLEFWRRAARHITSMTCANPDLPLGWHVGDCHRGISPRVHFAILDRVHPDNRGWDWNKSNAKYSGLLSLMLPYHQAWILNWATVHSWRVLPQGDVKRNRPMFWSFVYIYSFSVDHLDLFGFFYQLCSLQICHSLQLEQ